MSHTNKTTHYELPQFIADDKPTWLQDVNDAYLKIDNGIYTAQNKSDDTSNQLTVLEGRVEANEGNINTLTEYMGTDKIAMQGLNTRMTDAEKDIVTNTNNITSNKKLIDEINKKLTIDAATNSLMLSYDDTSANLGKNRLKLDKTWFNENKSDKSKITAEIHTFKFLEHEAFRLQLEIREGKITNGNTGATNLLNNIDSYMFSLDDFTTYWSGNIYNLSFGGYALISIDGNMIVGTPRLQSYESKIGLFVDQLHIINKEPIADIPTTKEGTITLTVSFSYIV